MTPYMSIVTFWILVTHIQVNGLVTGNTEPLPEPKFPNDQLDAQERISVQFESKVESSLARNCIWKYRLKLPVIW